MPDLYWLSPLLTFLAIGSLPFLLGVIAGVAYSRSSWPYEASPKVVGRHPSTEPRHCRVIREEAGRG